MSLERILRALEGFGLSRVESEVYVYLAKTGPSKTKDLGAGLRMPKQQLYRALKGLQKKGIVTGKSEYAKVLSAITFEELLNLLMKLSAEKAKIVEETKHDLVSSWENMIKQNNS